MANHLKKFDTEKLGNKKFASGKTLGKTLAYHE